MNKVLTVTSQGQVTLPKKWRDKFNTNLYIAELKDNEIVFKPLLQKLDLESKLESSWQEYLTGNYVDHSDLEKYGL